MINERKSNLLFWENKINSFKFASQDNINAIKSQPNLWCELVAAIIVSILGLVLKISTAEWIFMVFAIGFVLNAKIFNSSVQKIVDLVYTEKYTFAGQTKNATVVSILISTNATVFTRILTF